MKHRTFAMQVNRTRFEEGSQKEKHQQTNNQLKFWLITPSMMLQAQFHTTGLSMFIQGLAIYSLLRSQICTHPTTFSETSSQLTASTWAKLKREPWNEPNNHALSVRHVQSWEAVLGWAWDMLGWQEHRNDTFSSPLTSPLPHAHCTSWPRWRHLFSEKAVDWCFFFAFWCPVFAWFCKGFTANSSWQFLTFKAST